MSNSIDFTPLRWSGLDLKNVLYGQNPYDGLFSMKNKSYEKLEDFIQELSDILQFVKNDTKSGQDYHDFFCRNSNAYAFAYQKIDAFYQKKTKELQSLWEKKVWEDIDSTKEKEIKSALGDLLKCEVAIDSVCYNHDGYTPHVFTQLENLFDDCELLDTLLVVIFKRMPNWGDNMEFLNIKGFSFVFPFLKLFYNGKGNILDFWNNPQEFLRKANAIEEVQKDIEKLLVQYTDLSESEISRFSQEIKSANGDILAKRRILRGIAGEKKIFKEEKGYYELLGNLSLILYLWRQKEVGTEVFFPLLRVGLVGFVFFMDGWKNLKNGFQRNSFEQYWRVNTLNFKDELDFPVKILRRCLTELKKSNDLNKEYCQLLSLDMLVCKQLTEFIRDYSYSEDFIKKFEECCDVLLVNLEDSQDKRSFLLNQLFEFFTSRWQSLNEVKSDYAIGASLGENLIYGWLDWIKGFEDWGFLSEYAEKAWRFKEKNVAPAKIMLTDLIQFISSEKSDFEELPLHLKSSLIYAGFQLYKHHNVVTKAELEKTYLDVQNLGLEILQNLRKGIANEKKTLSRFNSMLQLVWLFIIRLKDNFQVEESGDKFIKEVFESKLIEGFIETYEENKSLLQKTGDANVTEAIWELFGFIANCASKTATFYSKDRNLELLKSVLQDSCEIDTRLASRERYEGFTKRIQSLFESSVFVKYLKDEKLLFGILRLCTFAPFVHSWESDTFAEKLCQGFSGDLLQERTFLHLFSKFLRVFEKAMRDPSVDLYDAVKKFENTIEDEKKKYQEKVQAEGAEEPKEEEAIEPVPFFSDRKAQIKNFESLSFTAGLYCSRISLFMYKIPSALKSNAEKLNSQIESISRRYTRMSFDPLFMFACVPSFVRTWRSSVKEAFYNKEEMLIPFLEGGFSSIIEICEEFKLNEYSTLSKFDSKRFCKLAGHISAVDYLRREDIPEDITYEEAAFISFIIGVKNFNRVFREYYSDPSKKAEKVKDQFKEATILVDQVQNNILKFVSLELAEGQNAEKLGKELKWFADEWVFLMGTWLELPKTFNKREELRPMVEETFPLVFEKYDLSYEVQNVAGIIYNTLRLKEFDYSYLDNSMSMHILSSPEGLESLLKFELYLLDSANYYCDSKTKDVLGPLIELLTSIFQKHDFSSNEKALKVKCFEKEGKTLFPVILGFLKKLAERQVPQRNSKILMEANLNTVFSFFEEYYKFYAKYTKDQVTDLDTKIEELKKKDEPAAEKSEEETKKEESKVIEGEEEIKKEEKAVAETEEKIVETTEKVETEEKVAVETTEKIEEKAVETTEKVEEKAAEDKKEEPAVKLEDVEAEKKERIENYKTELQKYIDALVQCQQHHLVNLKESFTLGEEFNVVIPHDYWIKLFENASGNLAAYLKNLPQDSDLKGKLESLKSENEIKLIEVSKYKGVNQVYQLAFLYQRLEELFIKEIIGDLNLNKDLIEGLITATKETLESLAVDELTLLLKERECRDFPAVLSGFISNVTSIAINYIVSRVLENNCQLNEDDKFLSMCLDLTESVLSAQKCGLYGLRQDIFSQSSSPCYQDTICLMNAILRANKSLRVEFINRGILQKLFSVERLSPLITDEAISVLCLMTTLLEDSLALESQVDLVLKSISKKQEKSEISLEDLLQENNFKPFQNYKRVLEKLKVYGIKSTAEAGKTDVSEKDFSLSLPKDDNLVENLQKNLSPVAEECVQILLRTLIQNYSFEKTSSASSQKVTEQKESKRLQELDVKGKLPRGYLYFRDPTPNFEETYEPNVYLDKDSNRTVIQKETGSLVVILSGILTNYPHLIPSVIYQELSYEDVSKQLDNDQDLLSFFKSDSRWSVLDILLRLVLLKEGSSAVFLIASLIQDNIITSAKENQQTIELKYILLIKIFEILENILDSEEKQGKTLETLNSVFMRRNIATIVGFVSNEMNKEDQPSLSSHKEEILQLIMGIARKLLRNPQMIAWSMQDNNPNQSMIRILSSTVKQNTSKSMTLEEVAENYANILKALKTRGSYEPKTFQVNLKETFEKNLSAKKESKNKISHEDQKKFEMWVEKSQFEKEEAQKLFEIAGLKEDKELISEIRLAAYGDVAIGDINLNSIFSEHSWLNEIKNLYKTLDTIKGKPFKSDTKFKIDYFLNRLEASKELGSYQKDSTQSIGVDSDILLPLFKADTKKIESLKNDTLNIAKLYVKEQTGGSQEKVEQPVEKPAEASTEVEKEKDQESGEKDTAEVKEEAKVEGSSDSPATEADVEKKEDEKAENQDSSFKYFMDTTVRNEANFRYRVNQAVIQGKRVKEMVCVDKILKGAEKNSENVIKQFTTGMKEFDRNVVYASLGKTFGADLSEEFRKIAEEARKELEDIQKDWSKYEEAKNKIPKPATEESKEEKKEGEQAEIKVEEQKESEPEKKNEDEEEDKKEDENSEYGEFDYDIQFLAAAEKDKEKKENEDSEEEEKKEDAENKNKEEDKKDDTQATLTEVVEGEEAKKDEKSEEAAKKEAETKEKILKTLNSFAVDDSFIMNVFELFFCYFNPSSGNQHLLFDFLKDSLSLNPVNEFKIFDVMITILYTPEFFDCLKGKNFQIEVRSYEKAVEKIIDYISRYFDDAARSYVFFAPKAYLENFGVSFLKDLKETTHFAQKVSDCHTLLDMLLGLIETKLFTENERWIVKILKGMSTLISKEKAVKLAEGVSQVDDYKKTISCKKLLSLLSLIEKPTSKDSESSKQVKDVFMNLKSIPELFVPFQDYLSSHFYQEIIKANKAIDHIIKVFKQNQEKQIGKAEIDEILSHINFPQFELILTIMFSFANVFHFNLLVKEQKESKAAKKLRALLQTVNSSLFNEEEVKVFFISAYELAELIHNNKYQDGLKELWNLLIMVCVGHYSIIIMERNLEEKKPDSSNDLRKQTGGSSLSDVEQMPSLARLVSFEETGEHHEMMAPLQRSYSHYRRELDVDFGTIFANFALKSSTQISNIINDQKTTALKTVLSNLISILIPKYPWIIDLKTKLEIFSNQVQDHFKTYGIENRYYRREITVKRKNLVFSALMQYKEQSREDLLKNLEINFKDERGVDGGGLRRDFYEIVTRQLFDPSAGLFKLASNQISIQPNPMSGLVPYDSTLMQFAGIMLAKAICDSNVVDLNFTKPFLKHILGKKITIADMEEVDADIGKNLRWILENNVEELYLTFTHEIEHLDDRTVIELKEGGSDIFVDEENKKEYVKQICEYRMTKQIKKQLKDFLKGFRMVLPRELISHFSTAELETMIAGESKIDIAEMKKHAYYRNYSQEDQIIIWLFEILEEFSPHQLTTFYYFTSGSTKVPFGGFKDNPIRIYHNSNKEGLPIAHTCSYAIEIPPYDSKDKLREKLLMAIFDGAGEFQIS